MRALVCTTAWELEVCDVEAPRPRDDEVVVRVEAAGICASDVHGVASRSPRRAPPLIMGHELVGEVVDAGGPAGVPFVGLRATVNPQVPCGHCPRCRSGRENVCGHRELIGGTRPGGFAELVAVPVRCLHALVTDAPAGVAVLCEPLATCLHALSLVSEKFHEVAVVLGGGAIGSLAAQLLRVGGSGRVIVSEPQAERHPALGEICDLVVTPEDLDEAVRAETGGEGADLSIDAVGTRTTRPDSVTVLRPGGTALWLGMHGQDAPMPGFDMVVREQRIIGSFAYTNAEFGQALGLLERGRLIPEISRRDVTLDDSATTFRRLVDGAADGVLKEVVRPVQDVRAA